jgi:hypothetical protein
LTDPILLPDLLTGSYFSVRVAPTADYTATFKKNGVSIGDVLFALTTGLPTVTFTPAVSFAVGDVFEIVGQVGTDATVEDLSFAFAATFS